MTSNAGDERRKHWGTRIDTALFVGFPRTIRNRAAVIYHATCAQLNIDLPKGEVFAACLSCAMKECCANTKSSPLVEMRGQMNEVNVAAVEVLIVEYVRPHVILIESCLRLQLKMLVVQAPYLNSFREPISRVALALVQDLYRCSYCLLPETCARACLFAACALYPIDVDYSTISADFYTPLVEEVYNYMLFPDSVDSSPVLSEP